MSTLDDTIDSGSVTYQYAATGTVQRTVHDRLSDSVNILDFGAKFDGVTDDSAAWLAAWNYATVNGKIIRLPAGTSNVGTARFSYAGASNGFGVVGEGAGISVLKFADVPPTAAKPSEPSLFNLSGSVAAPIMDARLEGFTIDYSAQSNKGGTDLSNLALTDIKPYSIGVRAIAFSYCVGIRICNVNITEVYGDGIVGNRSPFTRIDNCRLWNVSGGNPGSADSFGGGIALMRGCYASKVSDCIAFNLRQYQTDTIAGYTNVTSKNTPCGYIGFWSEFPMNVDNLLPPYASNWLTGNATTDRANFSNDENMGTVFDSCVTYGYTIGFKAEGGCPIYFNGCVSLNCWMPFMGSATRGRALTCYADCLNLDGKQCPMSGYQYVRALFVHYNVTNPERRYAGFTFDGCISHSKNTGIFTDNCGSGKFLNQQTWIDYPGSGGVPLLFATRSSSKGIYNSEIRGGHIQIEGLTEATQSDIFDCPGLLFDVSISNLSKFPYRFNFSAYYAHSQNCEIRIRAKGLISVSLSSGTARSKVDFSLIVDDTTLAFPASYNVCAITDESQNVRVNIEGHSTMINGGGGGNGSLCSLTGMNCELDFSVDILDAGSNTMPPWLIFLNGNNNKIKRAVKTSDKYEIPLIEPGVYARGWHLEMASANDNAPIVNNAYTLIGPITLGKSLRGAKLFKNALSVDPNNISNLANTLPYPEGLNVPYLKPSLGGAIGWRVFMAGYSAPAWIASHAYVVNAYVRNSGNVYQCTTAGASAASGGPTGTGTGIADGTAVWIYIGPFAQFVEYGSYAATALT